MKLPGINIIQKFIKQRQARNTLARVATLTTYNKKQERKVVVNNQTLYNLATTDVVTSSIIRAIKNIVSQIGWDIVPDIEFIKSELERWRDIAIANLNKFKIILDFKSDLFDTEEFNFISYGIEKIVKDPTLKLSDKRKALNYFFNTQIKRHNQEAYLRSLKIKKFFKKPNEDSELSFDKMQNLVLQDLLIYDAGAIVKRKDEFGNFIEMYSIPGDEVKIFRNPDLTIPKPPDPAYSWERLGSHIADFTTDELVYLQQNPQHDGYGFSPIESAVYIITGSLYADSFNIQFFKNNNIPAGIYDLGASVTPEQREAFQRFWDEEIMRAGNSRILFVAGSENAKGFSPVQMNTNRDMQYLEYLKWTTNIKCAVFGLSPQDIGIVSDFHRTTARTQKELTEIRGIKSVLQTLASYYNAEIISKDFKVNDVKFTFEETGLSDPQTEANVDSIDLDRGVISINERRKRRGLPEVDGGDKIYIKLSTGEIKTLEQLDAETEAKEQEIENIESGNAGKEKEVEEKIQTAQKIIKQEIEKCGN